MRFRSPHVDLDVDGTTEDRYFEWLYSQVGAVSNRNPRHCYWDLLRTLHVKEFVWLIPNDDNRVEEGKELRYEFIEVAGIDEPHRDWMELGCSMLEMLIALARRASFESDKEPAEWFWRMLENVGLRRYNDAAWQNNPTFISRVNDVLDDVIFRNYDPDGQGGLFPLQAVHQDQRQVELWYQLSAYLLEGDPV